MNDGYGVMSDAEIVREALREMAAGFVFLAGFLAFIVLLFTVVPA